MRASSDRLPIVLTLTAFVLMFIGQSAHERLAEAWILQELRPWLSAGAAELVERFAALALAAAISLYVTGGLYLYLRREFARQAARMATARPHRPGRDVWLYDAICRIFLGRWEAIELKGGKLDLDHADAPVLHDLVSRHIRQLAAEGTLPIWGRQTGNWGLWELAPPEFWKHHQVDYQSFLEADPKLLHALPCHNGGRTVSFGELMTSKTAVDAFCDSVAL
ncbi:MAG TPA: hypothetical protein VIY51_19695 [Xanthobacteraceae bacterium]